MLFTDSLFLFYFLPAALALHALTTFFRRGPSYNNTSRLLLFFLTLVFYGVKQPWWLLPFFVGILFDFLWASLLMRIERPRARAVILSLSVAQNLTLLGIFKYWDFLGANLVALFPQWAGRFPHFALGDSPIPMPAGISFYTFESLSFVIDVYRRELIPPRNPLEFFAFIGMFPRFIAGPIVRYKEMTKQFARYGGMQIERGLYQFVHGLFLKVCFADNFALLVDYAFGNPANAGFFGAWIGVIAYTMQIYFDFSGYSMMAIGIGRCLGFEFPANFKTPYLSTSLTDFWRRWHISLSSWLRDYLYRPLGGNKHGTLRTYLNLFLTMLLGGIWHGASWMFVAWGAWHGACLAIERALGLKASRARTMLIVMIGWVFFRASSMGDAATILAAMFSPWRGLALNPEGLLTRPVSLPFCAAGILYCFWLEPRLGELKRAGVAVAMFAVSLVIAFSSMTIPFLYFQF